MMAEKRPMTMPAALMAVTRRLRTALRCGAPTHSSNDGPAGQIREQRMTKYPETAALVLRSIQKRDEAGFTLTQTRLQVEKAVRMASHEVNLFGRSHEDARAEGEVANGRVAGSRGGL
jgi:hypothetical protein